MVVSTVVVAVNAANIGLNSFLSHEMVAATVASTSKTLIKFAAFVQSEEMISAVDSALHLMLDGGEDKDRLKVAQKVYDARKGNSTCKSKDDLNFEGSGLNGRGAEAYDAMKNYTLSYIKEFAALTSLEISETIDSHFEPFTAEYLKGQYALLQLLEMADKFEAEVSTWKYVGRTLGAIGIAETLETYKSGLLPISRGLLSLINAYAKPVCGPIPFPCIPADNIGCPQTECN